MAVKPTGAIYKTLNFDGQSSGTYGVYITGDAVFNAPEREVEMIAIPGRNGAFALDKGRFENITVTYPAGIFAETEEDFADAISDFRNYLCSRKGYCRLTDDYSPDEYRMALYKSGLEVDPALLKAGQFNITFDCKPQRFLNVGETEQTIAQSGDTLTNPTLFESNPLLMVKGYGKINFNGYEIELENVVMGEVALFNSISRTIWSGYNYRNTIPQGVLNVGDDFTLEGLTYTAALENNLFEGETIDTVNTTTSASHSGLTGVTVNSSLVQTTARTYEHRLKAKFPSMQFAYGTARTITDTATYTATVYKLYEGAPESPETYSGNIAFKIVYNGQNTVTYSFTGSMTNNLSFVSPKGTGNSTVSILGNPTYIDCDIGEAYMIKNGEIVSLNAYIDLGSKLPTLVPGSNAITFDNTITELKIVPRWWKV